MGIFTHPYIYRALLTLVSVLVIWCGEVKGQVSLPHYDAINYTVGQGLQNQTNWTTLNSGDNLLIASGNLSYTGLPVSTGNKVTFDGAGIDAAKLFSQQTSGTVYYSFLLNVTSLGSLNANGGYFTGFTEGATTIFGCSVWTRLNGIGYDIGINPRTTAANTIWVSGVQSVNNTILVVISYQIVGGTTNDVVKIWINPTLGGAEPPASATATNTTLPDLANVNRILIRQDALTATPSIEMDELRIGTTWASVTPNAGPTLIVSPATLSGFTYAVGNGPSTSQSYSLSGSNLTPASGNISISGSANYEVSSDNSTFSSTASVAYTSGIIASTNVYIRLKSGLSVGNYNSELIKSGGGGATDVDVTCSGLVYNQLDWVNLQWPSTGTITLGGNYGVYAQVYEPGVTDAFGQGAGISCWIGYSTSNSDPSGSGWTWVPANYNLDFGNNDEYSINIGPSIPSSGTYYLASRFQVATAPPVYGGCNVGGGSSWDGIDNVSGNLIVNPPPQIDWANLQFPPNGTISLGGNFDVYAQVYKSGITEPAGQGAGITCWIGYSTTNTNPSTWTNWVPATYNVDFGNNDEYIADLGTAIPAIGTYYYASRFKYGLADYVYGGYNATGGGFWNGATNLSGVLTVNPLVSQVVISQVYGGGGNTGATYKNDFIELFNRGTTPVNLNGWSVQYASTAGTTWTATNLSGSIAPGQYYLIQEAFGAGGTVDLPTPDATGSITMAADNGKVALVNNTFALTGACPPGSNIVDIVGFGTANCYEGTAAAPGTDNTIAVLRASDGCIDTDHNDDDFITGSPNPRNSSNSNVCLGILLSRTALNGFTYTVGNGPSAGKSFIVEGKTLTNNIVINAPVDYEISLVSGSGFTNTITLIQNGGNVVNTKMYVRLKSGLPVGSYIGEIINITSIGVTTETVTLNGSVCPSSTLPFYENFDYTDGSLLTNNCWAAHSSAGLNPITVTSGSIITYPCYLSSGIGNQVILYSPATGTTAEDANRSFPSQTAGTVYASFLVNITSATATGDYFFHLGPSIGTIHNGKVWVKQDASNNVSFGISKASSTPAWTPFLYSLGTTYLIILKYTINPGIDNDVASIFINPPLVAVEPSSGWLVSTDSPFDPSDIGSVALRQGSSSIAPVLKLDGIRVSTNWSDISSPTPPPTGTTPQIFCASEDKKVSDITIVGSGIVWYDASTAGTVVPAGTTLVNGTTYYASQTVAGCESVTRLAVSVTVADPAAPTGSASQSFCSIDNPTIANLSATGLMIQWYTASTGGTLLAGTTALVTGTTYYASQTVDGCESDTRLAVSVTVTDPATPTGSASQAFCSGATVAVLIATGTSIQWYDASAGGTALATSTSLTNSTHYFASQTIGLCESKSRFDVTVTITPPVGTPVFTSGASSTRCQGSGTVTYNATAANTTGITYTLDLASLAAGNTINAGTGMVTYIAGWSGSTTVIASAAGCNGPLTATHTVTITAAPAHPTGTTPQKFCGSATVANLTATGTGIKWYAAASGGAALGNSTPLSNVQYYASQTLACESVTRLAVQVFISNGLPVSAITVVPTTAPCPNTAGLVYTVTNNPGTVYTWTVPSGWDITSGQGTNSITVISGNIGDNGNIDVSALNPCSPTPTTSSLAVSITVPDARIVPNYCYGGGKIELTALPGPSGYTYQWYKDGNKRVTTQKYLVDSAAIYTVTVKDNITLCSASASITLSTELVINGSFNDAVNLGFTSDYTFVNDIPGNTELYTEKAFGVGPDPQTYHDGFYGRDHTSGSGNFMIINGYGRSIVWSQTMTGLSPNTNYYFSAWGISLNSTDNTKNAKLQFRINGVNIGNIVSLLDRQANNNPPYNWRKFYGAWPSGSSTSALLEIVDLQDSLRGNDFGIDDISFGTLVQTLMELTVAANGDQAVCEGGPLNLSVEVNGGRPPYTFAWTGPNGFTSDVQYPNIPVATTDNNGIYTVVIKDSSGPDCPEVTAYTPFITVLPSPTATISGGASVCLNDPTPQFVTFTGSGSTAPYTFTYHINTGPDLTIETTSGNSIALPVPTNVAGNYTYTITAVESSNGCSQLQAAATTFNIKEVSATITRSAASICEGEAPPSILFTGIGGAPTYTFNYTLNSVAQSVTTLPGNSSISVQVPAPALTYNYSLVSVISSGCTQAATATESVTVNARPVINLTGPTSVCGIPNTGNVYTTDAGMSNYTWAVSAGGTITSATTGNTVTVTWTAIGIPTISVNYTGANGCAAVAPEVLAVGVNSGAPDPPTAIPFDNQYVCVPANGVVYNVDYIAGVTYTWSYTGTGATINNQGTNSITIDFAASATSGQLSVVASNPCGANATARYRDIIIYKPRTANAGGPLTICSSTNSVNLVGSYSPDLLSGEISPEALWSVISGTGSITNPTSLTLATYTPSAADILAGTVTLNLRITSGPCLPVSNNQKVITINQAATVNAGSNQTMCAGTSIILAGSMSVNASSPIWTGPPPFNFTLPGPNSLTPTFTPSGTGLILLTLTANPPGFPASQCPQVKDTNAIRVIPRPTITLGSNPVVCSGTTTANLTYSATTNSPNRYNIVWSAAAIAAGFINVTNAILPVTPVVLSVPGAAAPATYTFTVTVSNSANGCLSTSYNKSITVNPIPAAVAGADRAICLNTSTSLGAVAVAGRTYSWSTVPAGFTSNVSNPTVSPLVTTTYTIVETITATGCTNSNSVVVTVNPLPDAAAGADRAVCLNTSTTLGAAAVAGRTYSWTSVPAGFTSSAANPTVAPLVNTTYTVVETITATGCNNSGSVVVTVTPLPTTSLIYHF